MLAAIINCAKDDWSHIGCEKYALATLCPCRRFSCAKVLVSGVLLPAPRAPSGLRCRRLVRYRFLEQFFYNRCPTLGPFIAIGNCIVEIFVTADTEDCSQNGDVEFIRRDRQCTCTNACRLTSTVFQLLSKRDDIIIWRNKDTGENRQRAKCTK